ncbi:MAG: hypothetical protein M0Z85_03310, partial [Gammaproteobacteria bacterium]|nr:hypothetical protein [Gammaproteobacteria bacterium]
AIGALLVLAAMILYVPVSRSLIDQGVVGQQTLSEAVNYDFDVRPASCARPLARPILYRPPRTRALRSPSTSAARWRKCRCRRPRPPRRCP